MTEAIYDEMFNLNAKGPFFAVQKFAPLINGGGSVVLTTSVANVKGMPGQATYGAAKAALRSFARTLAVELLPLEIRVNAVTPGPIDTPILDKAFPDKAAAAQMREKVPGMIPMKRFGTSEEIAKAVLFFARRDLHDRRRAARRRRLDTALKAARERCIERGGRGGVGGRGGGGGNRGGRGGGGWLVGDGCGWGLGGGGFCHVRNSNDRHSRTI